MCAGVSKSGSPRISEMTVRPRDCTCADLGEDRVDGSRFEQRGAAREM
jgi:hypothetical protein